MRDHPAVLFLYNNNRFCQHLVAFKDLYERASTSTFPEALFSSRCQL